MNRLTLTLILALCLTACAAPVQRQIEHMHSNTVDVSTLEGVTLTNGQSTMLIVANARIQQTVVSNNTGMPSTFLQKVGPYEIHRSAARVAATDSGSARPNFMVNGKTVPVFADDGTGQDFLGVAYLMDTKQMGLISKEIAVKFKTSTAPKQYADMGAKELVPRSGLYVFTVTDIYSWINLVSRLQADAQVSVVEPQIKTEFA
ncbi:MAG: hypothetical protein RJB34_728 [Pseudomonadota bacterium]|jgi:hypothetical protein